MFFAAMIGIAFVTHTAWGILFHPMNWIWYGLAIIVLLPFVIHFSRAAGDVVGAWFKRKFGKQDESTK